MSAASPGCDDPVNERAIEDLGEEAAGVPVGPLHRPGQPCLVCHDGREATALSVAGTIYRLPDSAQPVAGARVHLIDASSVRYLAATNCAGNFFVRPGDFTPVYPMWVRVELGDWLQEMESPVNGNGSCAGCHASEPGPSSAGRVHVLPFEAEIPEVDCP